MLKSYFASIISEKGRIQSRIREAKKHADPEDPDPDTDTQQYLQGSHSGSTTLKYQIKNGNPGVPGSAKRLIFQSRQ